MRLSHWSAMLALVLTLGVPAALGADYKVLVVMSYEENNPWCKEIREGIDGVLAPAVDVRYFYMNTKVDRAGGPAKAAEAKALFDSLKPDGVIAAAEKYAYPNGHISGVLERAHVRESLAFAKQLLPALGSACFLTNDVPAGRALRAQVDEEKDSYPVKPRAFHHVKSLVELDALGKALRACDVLFVDSLEGIVDAGQQPIGNSQVLGHLAKAYAGPVLGGNRYQVEQGAWAAVVKTGQEQGETAAEMLLQAMRGARLANLPVVKNSKGQRVINVSAMEAHGVPLKPLLLRGAILVKQQP